MAAARHRRHHRVRHGVVRALPIVLITAALGYAFYRMRSLPTAPFEAASSNTPSVLLLTVVPRCIIAQGQFFLTKAMQTKLELARRYGWTFMPLGGGELNAASAMLLLPTSGDEMSSLVDPEAQWPSLLHHVLASQTATWVVWMDAELLVRRPDAGSLLQFAAWEEAGLLMVIVEHGSSTDYSMSFASVRACEASRELLRAWTDRVADSTAVSATDAARELRAVLEANPGWRARVRIVDDRRWIGTMDEGEAWLASFRSCQLCARARPAIADAGASREAEDAAPPSAAAPAASCQRALMRAFTAARDAGPLRFVGAQHAAPGSVHVRPANVSNRAGGGWLQRHRGGLGRCLPSLLIVGAQRSALASVHYAIRQGWHRSLRVNAGERELHFFSMDNRFRNGLLSYEQRFHRDSKTRGGCPTRASHVLVEVSSTYFDYPKAPLRVAGVLPAVRIAVVLREPVGRALSAYNVR